MTQLHEYSASLRLSAARSPQLSAVGVRALLESLRLSNEDRLSCLELDFNPIGDAGAQPFPAYLKLRAARGGGGLEELSLRFCDIGPAGCRYALRHTSTSHSVCHVTRERRYFCSGAGLFHFLGIAVASWWGTSLARTSRQVISVVGS